MKTKILYSALLAGLPFLSFAQKGGCVDPLATNYDATATFNNGSCQYRQTDINMGNGVRLPQQLNEISGMVYWNGKMYGHQDSGGPTNLYEFDTTTGQISRTITLQGTTNVDWEDMTQDDTHFYIGDVGNNTNGNRRDLKIYKFPKSLITGTGDITIPSSQIEIINFSYEDQTNFSPTGGNKTAFDCEAIAYNRGKLHLFTKNWIGQTTTHYTLPITAGTHIARKRDSYNTGTYKITGADFGAYDILVLTAYEVSGVAGTALFLDFGFDGTYFYLNSGNKRRLNIGSAAFDGQIEAVAMDTPLSGYVSNEYFQRSVFGFDFSVPQQVKKFSILDYIKEYYKKNPLDLNELSVPEVGTIRYNSNTHKIEGFDGTHWNPFGKL